MARTTVELESCLVTYLWLDRAARWSGHDGVEPRSEVATRRSLRMQTVTPNGGTQLGRATGGTVGLSGSFRQRTTRRRRPPDHSPRS